MQTKFTLYYMTNAMTYPHFAVDHLFSAYGNLCMSLVQKYLIIFQSIEKYVLMPSNLSRILAIYWKLPVTILC